MISGGSICSTKVSEFQSGTALLSEDTNLLTLSASYLDCFVARSYRELFVWKKARSLVAHVYRGTEQFPRTELYGLTSQVRRAAISVVSNIAEGQGRITSGEFLHFLGQSRRSLLELDAQLLIASGPYLSRCRTIREFIRRDLPGVGSPESSHRIPAEKAWNNGLYFETLKL
jgi:four helix bundle protein